MRIGLIGRSLNSFDTETSLRDLAQELTTFGHECLLFLSEKELKPTDRATRFASFYISLDGKIFPVQVQKVEQGPVLLFAVSSAEAAVFAAAVAVILQKLAEKEIKIDLMHLFNAEDLCTALACRQYSHVPFVYSVRNFKELKQRKTDFLCLKLKPPSRSVQTGDYLYVEQLAAETARYVVDETAMPKLWPVFFSAFAGKCVVGKPYVQAMFWAKAKGKSRPECKKELLQHDSPTEMVVLAAEKEPLALPETLRDRIVFLPEAKTTTERQKQYQAADFYWCDEKTSGQQIVAAMAAGCIPLVPEKSHLTALLEGEASIKKACYFYAPDTLEATLLTAYRDFSGQTKSLWAKRQQLVQAVHELYSLKEAAALYDKIYRNFVPAHLPFLLANQQIPAVTGRWEER